MDEDNADLERARVDAELEDKAAARDLAERSHQLAVDRFEWEKKRAANEGWRVLLSPTGVVVVGAALGLIGTAVGKWADYKVNHQQQQTSIILKASEVSSTLSSEDQATQRARNLLWFAQAGYVDLPPSFIDQLVKASNLESGKQLPSPVIQSSAPAASDSMHFIERAATPGVARFGPTPEGLDLIKSFEGSLPTIRVVGSFPTIGYGHPLTKEEFDSHSIVIDGKAVAIGDGLSADAQERLLKSDLVRVYASLDQLVTASISRHQRDALASFVWNVGPAALKRSTILDAVNAGHLDEVPDLLKQWNKLGGRQVESLTRRRAAEAALWLAPDPG